MSEKLKPCPFCGGEAEYKRSAIKTGGAWCDAVCVRCTACDARTGRILFDAKKHPNDEEYDEAAHAWNRRANQTTVNQYGDNCTHIANCGTLNLNL